MPNPIEIIKEDHESVKKLFEAYNQCGEGDDDKKTDIAKNILKELTIHAKMEEKYFYPRLKEKINDKHPMNIDEAEAEHHSAKVLIMELNMLPVSAENYDAKMTVLQEQIEHHVEEEESELLPESKKVLDAEEMENIGKEMEDYREHARKDLWDKIMGE